ncbi:hypothetical protein ACXDF8_09225 [Mycolicibacterium sp. CBM1]
MTALLAFVLLTLLLLAPFSVVAAIALLARREGTLRLRPSQFRVSAPLVGYLSDDDNADSRRIAHDLDAVRTRFEQHPSWPSSGALGERR